MDILSIVLRFTEVIYMKIMCKATQHHVKVQVLCKQDNEGQQENYQKNNSKHLCDTEPF